MERRRLMQQQRVYNIVLNIYIIGRACVGERHQALAVNVFLLVSLFLSPIYPPNIATVDLILHVMVFDILITLLILHYVHSDLLLLLLLFLYKMYVPTYGCTPLIPILYQKENITFLLAIIQLV